MALMELDTVLAETIDQVGYVTFNNPKRHNAMSLEMWEATAAILEKFKADDDVRVVVLRGAGKKAFISGADISKFGDERATKEGIARYNLAVERANSAIHQFPKPTIAEIRGYCIGGGLGVAVCCDIRIGGEDARFAVPAAKLGLGYDYPGLKRLVDVVGPAFTKEIFFTARQFDAPEALAMGLVNRVTDNADLESYVRNYAQTIAGNAPLTIGTTKLIVGEILKDADSRDMAACRDAVTRCFESSDYIEGRTAFMEKRKPAFTGR